MMATGLSGYVDTCHKIVGAAKRVEAAIREDERLNADLMVLGRPLVSVVAFSTRKESSLYIYDVADAMSAKGWHLNALQDPAAVHVAVTLPIVASVDQLIEDMASVIQELGEKERRRVREGGGGEKEKKKRGDVSALYGVAGALPDKTVVRELARGFLDCLYKA